MQIAVRRARACDFDYCSRVYFASMERIIKELKLDPAIQAASFQRQWHVDEVGIVTVDEADIGWLQSMTAEDGSLFLGQLFIEVPFQRRGIGTTIVNRLIGEANKARQAVTLGVVKTNPALRLYERLGFRVTHEDDRKYYMRREADPIPPQSN